MTIHILTIFPEYFVSPFGQSMLRRAQESATVTFHIVDIRKFALDKHQMTDDRPYGGGPGMVMKIEPIAAALDSLKLAKGKKSIVILTSAKGVSFTQQKALEYVQYEDVVLICGHYEGVDERVAMHLIDEEVRIGEYVLTGGEPAALVIADAVTRLLPGVLGNVLSNQQESHSQPGLAGVPQFTRPEIFRDWRVPNILLQGNHKDIHAWRENMRQATHKNLSAEK